MQSRSKSSITIFSLICLSLISFFARLPSINLGLPPHIFVDELFFFDDVYLHLNDSLFFPQSFVSGAINEIPLWVVGRVYSIFGIDLSYQEFLKLGRLLLPLFLTSITVFPLYSLSLNLNRSRKAAFLSVLLFVGSPWVFSNSQIWYPDHYIYFFVCLFLLQVSKFWTDRYNAKLPYLIGVSFSVLVSVKYTALIFIVTLFLVMKLIPIGKRESRNQVKRIIFKSVLISGITYLVINYSIFWHVHGFLQGMNSNRKNYRFFTNFPFKNLWAYSELLFLFGLGSVGMLLVALGMLHYKREGNPFLKIWLITILAYLVILSTSPLMVPRNVNLLIPVLAVIGGASAEHLLKMAHSKRVTANFIFLLILPLALVTLKSTYVSYQDIRKPDSYTLVKQYVKKNIPQDKVIGINPGSDGASPVEDLGHSSIADSMFKLSLDYYVINSYWQSPFMPYFHGRGFFSGWSSRNFHFYEGSADSATKLFRNSSRIQDYVPKGYIVRSVIESVGPTFVVLQRSDR